MNIDERILAIDRTDYCNTGHTLDRIDLSSTITLVRDEQRILVMVLKDQNFLSVSRNLVTNLRRTAS